MKIVTIEVLWLLHWCTKLHAVSSSRLWVIRLWNFENRTHTHTYTYIRMPAKNYILDVSDYSEYSNTNVLIFFARNHSCLSEEAIWTYCTCVAYFFILQNSKWNPRMKKLSLWGSQKESIKLLLIDKFVKLRNMLFYYLS